MRRARIVTFVLGCLALVAGIAALEAPVLADDQPSAQAVIEDLGPASLTAPIGAAEPVGDQIWLATTGLSPNVVSSYDPTTQKATERARLPRGDSINQMVLIGDWLYVCTGTPGMLYRINVQTYAVEELVNVAPDTIIWTIAASPDGKLFMGTYPGARVLSYDPVSGTTTNFGRVFPNEQYVRAIAASETTIYAGIGARAHLVAIDRATGEKRDILPPEALNATFVGTLALHGDTLLGSLSDRGDLLVMDTKDPSRYRIVDLPGDLYIVAITPNSDEAFLGLRPSGKIYRYKLWDAAATELATPIPEAYTDRLIVRGSKLIGITDGVAYVLNPDTGQIEETTDLVEAGMVPSPEQPMAIAADREHAYVSGKGGVQVHSLLSSAPSSRTFVPGEAKVMVPHYGDLYLGVYTLAQIHRMGAGDERSLFRAKLDQSYEQTRPMDAVYARGANALLMSTQPDYGKFNGALSVFRLGTGQLDTYRNILPSQTVRGVASLGRYAYLGGDINHGIGAVPPSTTTEAKLARFDLVTREITWMVVLPGIKQVVDLVAREDVLVGLTERGTVFGADPSTGALLWQVPSGATIGRLVETSRGEIYGADRQMVYRVNVAERTVTPVVTGLNGSWFGGTVGPIAASYDGRSIFTLRDRNLIRIRLP
jgi:outer membrane protein assembly factor BamB